jgi:hypothetical protein
MTARSHRTREEVSPPPRAPSKKKAKRLCFVMNGIEKHRLETLAREQNRTMGGVIRHIIHSEWKRLQKR